MSSDQLMFLWYFFNILSQLPPQANKGILKYEK